MNRAYIIGISASLILPVAIYAPKGLAPLFALSALAVFALEVFENRSLKVFRVQQLILCGVLPLLGLISAIWSADKAESVHLAFVLLATLLGGGILVRGAWQCSAAHHSILNKLVLYGFAAASTLLLVEMVSGATPYVFVRELIDNSFEAQTSVRQLFNPGLSVTTLMLWPLLLLLVQQKMRKRGLLLSGTVGIIFFFGDANAPIFAFLCGVAAFLFIWFCSRNGAKLFLAATIAAVVLAPWIPDKIPDPRTSQASILKHYSTSDFHRVVIWKVAAEHIRSKIFLGEGLDGTRRLYGEDTITKYAAEHRESGRKWSFISEPIPLHPHNTVLQIWLELGAAGMLVLVLLILLFGRVLRSLQVDRFELAVVVAFSSNLMVISSLSYGAWQSWWLSGQLLAAMLLAALLAKPRPAVRET